MEENLLKFKLDDVQQEWSIKQYYANHTNNNARWNEKHNLHHTNKDMSTAPKYNK